MTYHTFITLSTILEQNGTKVEKSEELGNFLEIELNPPFKKAVGSRQKMCEKAGVRVHVCVCVRERERERERERKETLQTRDDDEDFHR